MCSLAFEFVSPADPHHNIYENGMTGCWGSYLLISSAHVTEVETATRAVSENHDSHAVGHSIT